VRKFKRTVAFCCIICVLKQIAISGIHYWLPNFCINTVVTTNIDVIVIVYKARILLLERPFPATEKVLATVIETGKYSQLSKSSCLVVKENYIQQKIEAYVSKGSCMLG
jgi:hypothetical protein